MKKKMIAEGLVNQKQTELEKKEEEEKLEAKKRSLKYKPPNHKLKRITLINSLRSSKVNFSQLCDMVFFGDVPFNQLEYMALHKIKLSEKTSMDTFKLFMNTNPTIKSLKLEECELTKSGIKTELSPLFSQELENLKILDIDMSFKNFFVGDLANKIKLISKDIE